MVLGSEDLFRYYLFSKKTQLMVNWWFGSRWFGFLGSLGDWCEARQVPSPPWISVSLTPIFCSEPVENMGKQRKTHHQQLKNVNPSYHTICRYIRYIYIHQLSFTGVSTCYGHNPSANYDAIPCYGNPLRISITRLRFGWRRPRNRVGWKLEMLWFQRSILLDPSSLILW